ncbi:hypothetical protein [[Scytonema hofmanni] UTEX B 1581]|uniref:hypothetical protein n=1 Tax=[Scytonema hofmanni] UTEX B 1581 TaxID=379535 RepID=UPI0004BB8BBA|nr:hypothetical protein [[Scytonema hofmanni] UTEX B 1581]
MYKGITLIENPQVRGDRFWLLNKYFFTDFSMKELCDRLPLLNKYFLTDFSMKELNDKNT